MNSKRDDIYVQTFDNPSPFTFNESVADVFPDMIRRSVPGYNTVIAMTGQLIARYARPGAIIYDLGCSLGASLLSAARHPQTNGCQIIGIDNSAAMLLKCRELIDRDLPGNNIQLIEGDLITQDFNRACAFIMNYTLQFISVEQRLALLKRIRAALSPGDALILSEKIELATPEMDALMINLHHSFKRAEGYSALEVTQKHQALHKVLIPETRNIHIQRLKEAGFSHYEFFFQYFNFASLIAIA